MSSITVHSLDQELDQILRQYAKGEGLSLNKTIKKLLAQALGLTKKAKKNDFSEFFGAWTEDEFQEFEKNTKDFEKIDLQDWQ